MLEAHFWTLIERSRAHASDCEAQAQALAQLLAQLAAAEIVAFDRHFHEQLNRAYHWDVWGVAVLALGGCSDDCFLYFRGWLIGQGHAAFEAVLADPPALLALLSVEPIALDGEHLLYAAYQAYETVVGETASFREQVYPSGLFERDRTPEQVAQQFAAFTQSGFLLEPAGEQWQTVAALVERFPTVAARVANGAPNLVTLSALGCRQAVALPTAIALLTDEVDAGTCPVSLTCRVAGDDQGWSQGEHCALLQAGVSAAGFDLEGWLAALSEEAEPDQLSVLAEPYEWEQRLAAAGQSQFLHCCSSCAYYNRDDSLALACAVQPLGVAVEDYEPNHCSDWLPINLAPLLATLEQALKTHCLTKGKPWQVLRVAYPPGYSLLVLVQVEQQLHEWELWRCPSQPDRLEVLYGRKCWQNLGEAEQFVIWTNTLRAAKVP